MTTNETQTSDDDEVTMFVPPGHFYSPIPDKSDSEAALSKTIRNAESVQGITIDDAKMVDLWRRFSPHINRMPFGDEKSDQFRYYFLNDMYSYGDAAVYFGLLSYLRPQRVIEIGSGYSSALALDARDLLGTPIDLTFVEPYPSRLNSLLREHDRTNTRIIVEKVQTVDLSIFDELGSGDILFVDSSHVAKTGSDVCFEIFDILPRLKAEVLVHFHDCFWPFEYPKPWAVDENRAWNELYFLRAFLMYNTAFEVMFFNSYFAARHPAEVEGSLLAKNPGGGLWLRRV